MPRPRPLPPTFGDRPFILAEARAAGVTTGRLRGGDLERPYRGVRALALPATHAEACRAYAAGMRRTEHFSHASAARLHGLPLPWRFDGEPVHVTAVLPAGRPRGSGVRGHALHPALARTVRVGDLRASHPVDAWCEMAGALTLRELVAVGDSLVRRRHPLATVDELSEGVRRWRGRRGCAALAAALPLIRPRTDSWEETMLRLDLSAAGLPEPEVNGKIRTSTGGLVAYVDLVYRRYGVLAEYDGEQHRTDSIQYARDVDRLDDLARLGWRVVRFTARHRGTARSERIQRVMASLLERGWRPD